MEDSSRMRGLREWPAISVIVPVWRETAIIRPTLGHLAEQRYPGPLEALVVDGAPEAGTLAVLEGFDVPGLTVRGLRSDPGRARQMNVGAARASGEVLLFLHADTRLPPGGLALVGRTLAGDASLAGGAFALRMDTDRRSLRLLAWLADRRNRLTRTPYGDQAQFFRAGLFRGLGGYPELPLMEDVAIMRRLRREGRRIKVLNAAVRTSARRYEEEGIWITGLRNVTLRLAYALGVPAGRLARWYRVRGRRT